MISREEWGADEAHRFDGDGDEIWAPQFWPVQKLVVHHTAWPGDELADAGTVQAIFREHAVTRGWGDIGYAYLVGPDGAVYEGRPEGSAGAHAEGFNAGTVGVAVLGTFSDRDPTPESRSALVGLLGDLCARHGVDPIAEDDYENPISGRRLRLLGVIGHRDLAATACPGDALYAELASIRMEIAGSERG